MYSIQHYVIKFVSDMQQAGQWFSPGTPRPSTNKMNCELMLTYDTPAYMFNVYKNQLSRQTGSRNLTGSKPLPTIWHTYMKLVTFLPSIVTRQIDHIHFFLLLISLLKKSLQFDYIIKKNLKIKRCIAYQRNEFWP